MTTAKIEKKAATPVVEESSEVSAADRAMSASMIASGIGAVTLGLVIILAEANAAFKDAMAWVKPVGPLSGKTTVAVIVFFLSWVVLHYVFKRKAISLNTAFIVTLVLLALGLLLTFPPVFLTFEA